MKQKLFIPLLVLIFSFTMTACVKEYTCKCTMTYSGQVGLPEPQTRDYPIKDLKKNARAACQENSKTYQEGTLITEEVCDLW